MATTALILFFSIPAAVVAGTFSREVSGGQLDILSSLPGVRVVHSAIAWCLCGACWLTISFLISLLFFWNVLRYSDPLVPAINLMLCGIALGTSD